MLSSSLDNGSKMEDDVLTEAELAQSSREQVAQFSGRQMAQSSGEQVAQSLGEQVAQSSSEQMTQLSQDQRPVFELFFLPMPVTLVAACLQAVSAV